jgi:SAM-dependent methyltransferase
VTTGYLHGYRSEEEERLRHQAQFFAPLVHDRLPFSECKRLVEVGCGVGAQSAILLKSFPELRVTGVDVNPSQIEAARRAFAGDAELGPRSQFVQMDAHALLFEEGAFDGAFLCWVLEHLPDPRRALDEVKRVLAPGAPIVCTEVAIGTMWLEPHGPDMASFWRAYGEHQIALGGDPAIGVKLGDLLATSGFGDIVTEPKLLHMDRRDPAARAALVAYTIDLLMTAAPAMVDAGRVTPGVVAGMKRDLERVASDEHGVCFYVFVQARARA